MANANPKNNQRLDRGKNRKAGNTPELTPEEVRAKLAKTYGIKPKTKAMIDDMLNDPKLTQREAYLRHHKTTNLNTVDRALNRTMNKPSVIGYKDSAVKKAKNRIVQLVDSPNETIGLKASQDILDRNEGKAVQKTENTTRTVKVSLDLTGLRLGAHYIRPEQIQVGE
jgi:hypothetical protein